MSGMIPQNLRNRIQPLEPKKEFESLNTKIKESQERIPEMKITYNDDDAYNTSPTLNVDFNSLDQLNEAERIQKENDIFATAPLVARRAIVGRKIIEKYKKAPPWHHFQNKDGSTPVMNQLFSSNLHKPKMITHLPNKKQRKKLIAIWTRMFETRTNPKGKTKVFDKKGNLTIHGKKVEKALVDMIKVDEGKIVSMGVDFDLDDDENVDGGYKRRKTKRKTRKRKTKCRKRKRKTRRKTRRKTKRKRRRR